MSKSENSQEYPQYRKQVSLYFYNLFLAPANLGPGAYSKKPAVVKKETSPDRSVWGNEKRFKP